MGLCCWATVVAAQGEYRVQGTVQNAKAEALEAATVVLLMLPDSNLAAYTLTAELGQYQLKVPQGRYLLQVSYVGYAPQSLPVAVARDTSLGPIALEAPSDSLPLIEITAAHLPVQLRGDTHILWSAAVLYRDGRPLWRHIGEARMTMADFSDDYLDGYLARNGAQLETTVGGYMLENEGVRLFSRIDGDYFTVLGLPLLAVLRQLAQIGELDT